MNCFNKIFRHDFNQESNENKNLILSTKKFWLVCQKICMFIFFHFYNEHNKAKKINDLFLRQRHISKIIAASNFLIVVFLDFSYLIIIGLVDSEKVNEKHDFYS